MAALTANTIPKATDGTHIGDSLLTDNATTLAYNTNKFTVTAANGNTFFAGVLSGGSGPTTITDSAGKVLSASLNTVAVANGGTGASSASITAFNNITGFTAAGATGTTSTNLVFSASPTFTGTLAAAAITASSTITQTSASATAFESGPNGGTNPVLRLVNSTASQADGISITGGAAQAGTTITNLSSGSNSSLIIVTKGTGALQLNNVGAAATPALTFGAGTNTGIWANGGSGTILEFSPNGSHVFGISTGFVEIASAIPIAWTASSTPFAAAEDTTMFRAAAGQVGFGTTGTTANGTIKAATATFTTLASDATHTDNTVCADTTSGLLYKGSGTIGICLGTSSARFKEGIVELQAGLKAILDLAPCAYFYKPGYGNDGAKRLYGFTAEQVVSVLPELVGPDGEGKPNSVDMVGLIPVLVNAVKDLAAQNQMLSERLNTLYAG